jgi:hypothetical protein
MRIKVTLKTPDVVNNALEDSGLDKDSEEYIELEELMNKYFNYGETLTVEFNTDTKNCVVMKK